MRSETNVLKLPRTPVTAKNVDTLPPPTDGSRFRQYWDTSHKDSVRGFGMRVMASGIRSYIFQYRNADGLSQTATIGRTDEWSFAEARERADELRSAVKLGGDPQREKVGRKRAARDTRIAHRDAPTVSELADRYIAWVEAGQRKRPQTIAEDKSLIKQWVKPELGKHKAADVSKSDVVALNDKIVATGTKSRANHVLALLSNMFTKAETNDLDEHTADGHVIWKLRTEGSNPCKGIERYEEKPRQRYLSEEELQRFNAALDRLQDQKAANVLRLLVATGARRGEVLRARWEQFDLNRAQWEKPRELTKQDDPHTVPLNAEAMKVLRKMYRERDPDQPFLFPSDRREGQPLEGVRNAWLTAIADAKLHKVRLHDLRHTFASHLISIAPIVVIKELMGHARIETTMRYSHVDDAAKRRALTELSRRRALAAKRQKKPTT